MPYKAVDELIFQIEEFNQSTNKSSFVIPKRGVIRKSGDYQINKFNFQVGECFQYRGRAYPSINGVLGKRTVFIKKQVKINGEKYFLELKGYGANGKLIYPREHDEGDIFYGMYYKLAKKEYDFLKVAQKLGADTSLPIALIEFDRDEFVKQLFLGLASLISVLIKYRSINKDLWINFLRKNGYRGKIGEYDWYEPKKAQIGATLNILKTIYFSKGPDALHETLKYLTSKDPLAKSKPMSFVKFDSTAGVVIRGCRSPLRVGDPNDKKMDTKKNRQIARAIGRNFRLLLEHGYLHSSPNTGNWTQAGELTDFEDVIDLRNGQLEFLEVKEFFGTPTTEEYVNYILGAPHTGALSPYFCEGIMGRKISLQNACKGVLAIMKEFV